MTWIDRLLRRRRIYDDLADEIRSHLDEKTEELIARGLTPRPALILGRGWPADNG